MSTFAVFGMTRGVAMAEAKKTVKTTQRLSERRESHAGGCRHYTF